MRNVKCCAVDDFYTGKLWSGVGIAANSILVLMIFVFTNGSVWFEIYVPKLMNYPFVSTCLTCGLYFSCCIQKTYLFRLFIGITGIIGFITNAIHLNEMVNTAVPISERFHGTIDYPISLPTKPLDIVTLNYTSSDADIGFFSFGIAVVSYSLVCNFFHAMFSIVWCFGSSCEDFTNNNGDLYKYHGSDDKVRFAGTGFGIVVLCIGAAQSLLTFVAFAGGIIIPTLFCDTYSFVFTIAALALNPPYFGRSFTAPNEPHHVPSVPSGQFIAYICFLVIATFLTFFNFLAEMSWKAYNDIASFCEHDQYKLFSNPLEFYKLNDTNGQQTVTYVSSTVQNSTMALYCSDNVISLFLLIFMVFICVLHVSMFDPKNAVAFQRLAKENDTQKP